MSTYGTVLNSIAQNGPIIFLQTNCPVPKLTWDIWDS